MTKHTLLSIVKLATLKTLQRNEYRRTLIKVLSDNNIDIAPADFLYCCYTRGYNHDGIIIDMNKTAFNNAIGRVILNEDNAVIALQELTKRTTIQELSGVEYHNKFTKCLAALNLDETPIEFVGRAIDNMGGVRVTYYGKEFGINFTGFNATRARRKLITSGPKKKALLSNAFSFNMVPVELLSRMKVMNVGIDMVPLNAYSVVGHADTANVIGQLLDREVPYNRETVSMDTDTALYVAQYNGPRLEEGATSLPQDATMTWIRVWFE